MVSSRDDVSWYTYSFEDEVERADFMLSLRLPSSPSRGGKVKGRCFFFSPLTCLVSVQILCVAPFSLSLSLFSFSSFFFGIAFFIIRGSAQILFVQRESIGKLVSTFMPLLTKLKFLVSSK